jgi:DNA-binding NtrC family response regulator
MLIDDEPIVGKRLGPVLEKMGCQTETFVEPAVALNRLAEQEFDVVVTDIRMEEVDGIGVLERVKALSPRTKVIMITGYATLEVAHEALAKGAFDFIAKPFEPRDMRQAVAKAAEALGLQMPEAAALMVEEILLTEESGLPE